MSIDFKTYFEERSYIALDLFIEGVKDRYAITPDLKYERRLAALHFVPGKEDKECLKEIFAFADDNELTLVCKERPLIDCGFVLNEDVKDFRFDKSFWVRKL